jgi:hypothetical protein
MVFINTSIDVKQNVLELYRYYISTINISHNEK